MADRFLFVGPHPVPVIGREEHCHAGDGADQPLGLVAFRYEPESFYKGAQISGAFLLAILLSGACLVFRRQREFQVGIDP